MHRFIHKLIKIDEKGIVIPEIYIDPNKYKIVNTVNIDINKMNTTLDSGGRFGNILFRNLVSDKIAKKYSLKFTYYRIDEMNKLGLCLFTTGNKTYLETLLITDENVEEVMFSDSVIDNILKHKNILFRQHSYNPFNLSNYCWCQTELIAKYIRKSIVSQKKNIIDCNPNKGRYRKNNDLIVHVRLGDIVDLKFNTAYEYYDKTLSTINFTNGFITSDSIEHEECLKLIKKYNLTLINLDEVGTIQFASVCKYVVLSAGTFSWSIGVMSFFSNVYYPKIKTRWHGNIFVFDDWNMVVY
jgi:hypothetical protein